MDSQIAHFNDTEQFKIDSNFADFEQINTDPIHLYLLSLGR